MKPFYLFFFWVVWSSTASGIVIPSAHNCKIYEEIDGQRLCSQNVEDYSDYLVSYGYKYCQLFLELRENWEPVPKAWAVNTGYCLQKRLADSLDELLSCQQIETFAFHSHPECYLENGFCHLSLRQRMNVVRSLVSLDLLWHGSQTLVQVLRITSGCMEDMNLDSCTIQ